MLDSLSPRAQELVGKLAALAFAAEQALKGQPDPETYKQFWVGAGKSVDEALEASQFSNNHGVRDMVRRMFQDLCTGAQQAFDYSTDKKPGIDALLPIIEEGVPIVLELLAEKSKKPTHMWKSHVVKAGEIAQPLDGWEIYKHTTPEPDGTFVVLLRKPYGQPDKQCCGKCKEPADPRMPPPFPGLNA